MKREASPSWQALSAVHGMSSAYSGAERGAAVSCAHEGSMNEGFDRLRKGKAVRQIITFD